MILLPPRFTRTYTLFPYTTPFRSLRGLQTYFTAGVKEVRAWTVKGGSTAPHAAAVIHTDFEQGFIRAETIGYEDFIRYRRESGAREAGRLRLEGKARSEEPTSALQSLMRTSNAVFC